MPVGEALKRKYGPLPAWGWASIVGVGAYLYIRHRGSGVSQSGSSTTSDTPAADQGTQAIPAGSGGWSGGGGTSAGGFDPGQLGDQQQQQQPDFSGIIGAIQGLGADFGNVQTVGSGSGQATTAGTAGSSPSATATKTSSNYGLHTVLKGDTLAKIEQTYGLTLAELRAYNPNFNFGAPLMAGSELRVRASAPSLSSSQSAGPNGTPIGTTSGTAAPRPVVTSGTASPVPSGSVTRTLIPVRPPTIFATSGQRLA